MNEFRKIVLSGVCAALCFASMESLVSAADVKAAAEAVVAKMPAQNPTDQYAAGEELVKLGPEGIANVCGMLTPPAAGGDTKVRYALNALTWYAHRPGKEAEATMYAGVLLKALGAASDNEVKAFLIRQLHLLESKDAVPALGKLLSDSRLCEPATQALLAIETREAAAVLAKALPSAKGKNLVTIVKALGELREPSVVTAIAGHARSEDTTLRRTALFALANIGDPSSEKILAQAAEVKPSYERSKVTSMYLLYAGRLADQGRKKDCARICRSLIKARAATGEEHLQSAALSVLVENLGAAATDDMMAALDSENKAVYAAALKLAVKIPGEAVTAKLAGKVKNASPGVKLEIIGILGVRGDKSALPGLLEGLKDNDKAVRLAAASAAARTGGAAVAPALIDVLETGEKDEVAAVKQIMMRLQGDDAMEGVAKALPGADSGTKVVLIEILSERRATAHKNAVLALLKESSVPVREASIKALGNLAGEADMPQLVSILVKAENEKERSALQSALASVARRVEDDAKALGAIESGMKGAAPEARCALLAVLPSIGGKAALESVLTESKGAEGAVKDAAVRALSDWPDVSAGAAMLDVARNSKELKDQVLAMRGYVRVVGASDLPAEKKAAMYSKAVSVAKRPEEKRLVLGGLSEIEHSEALAVVARHLEDKDIGQEAAAAAVSIACPKKRGRGLRGDDVIDVLTRVVAVSNNAGVKTAAEKHLRTLGGGKKAKPKTATPTPVPAPVAEADSEGFTPLFNGKDLTGWIGDSKGYVVEDGKMLCKPGGNIYTEKQYDNFIFRFEFKLTPGANNGLGIRTPSKGNAAYAGMELQILDNTAQKYAKLQPFQYHGSIYGVVPAKRGHLKPVGEWNNQEVIADGPKIKVILNDTVIVDADLSKLEQTDKMHNLKKHPGLQNKSGHIGFLGHGSVVEFRGMRIKKLDGGATTTDAGVTGPPEGFTALFNGKDLTGWKGLVANPEKRAKMSPEELKAAQAKADENMRAHWKVEDGVIVFDGKGQSLCTAKDYGDFEMLVDWKIKKNGDSGIYLRGSPQVQIWDTAKWPVGSGGLYNNKKNPSKPLKCADKPVGEWNSFRIKMIGERVTVHLNDVLVVDNTVLENYWNRSKPIYPTGQIELQNHGNTLYFRNVFIREIPSK